MATIMCSPHKWVGESRIDDTGSRQLRVSVIRWVPDSPYRWLGESLSKYFLKNSSHHRYAESSTPRITDTESPQLPASVIRGVVVSAYCWYGESLFEKKTSLASIFRTFNWIYAIATHSFKCLPKKSFWVRMLNFRTMHPGWPFFQMSPTPGA